MSDSVNERVPCFYGTGRFPKVAGRCPGCGGSSLFLGDGGYVTCARLDCPDPLAGDVDHLREDRDRWKARAEKAEAALAEVRATLRVAAHEGTHGASGATTRFLLWEDLARLGFGDAE